MAENNERIDVAKIVSSYEFDRAQEVCVGCLAPGVSYKPEAVVINIAVTGRKPVQIMLSDAESCLSMIHALRASGARVWEKDAHRFTGSVFAPKLHMG